MSVRTEIRKAVTETPAVMAAVGATEVAVERVRKAAADAGQLPDQVEARVTKWQADVEKAVGSIDPAYLQKFLAKTFDPKTLQSGVKEVPALALARVMEAAGKVEHRFEDLTDRGKKRLQGVATGEAAPIKEAAAEVEQAVVGGAKTTGAAVKRSAAAARKRTASTKASAAKVLEPAETTEVPETTEG